MLSHQDEIASSYRRTCKDLKEKLKIGLDKIYNTCRDSCQGKVLSNTENCIQEILDPLVIFERKLLQYVRIQQEFKTENKNLQMKLKELQLNLQAKNVCISKLKEDIVSHYVQIEFLRKHNEKLEGDLSNTRKRLNQFERSEEWLKQHFFSLQTNAIDEQNSFSDETIRHNYNKYGENQTFVEETEQTSCIRSNSSKKTDGENIDGLRKFHLKLIEIYHENIFMKKVLQKMKNITEREDKLKTLLGSNHDNFTVTKFQNVQKELQFEVSKEKEESKKEKIAQLNSIIDSLRQTILQLQFEKRNMGLSVFKIREYFLKMKDMQKKLKEMLRKNQSVTCTTPEKSWTVEKKLSAEKILELKNIVRNLKLEKLQMEIEHHEELQSLTGKFCQMHNILQNIKTVCDDITQNDEVCDRNSIKLMNENPRSENNCRDVENVSKNNSIDFSSLVEENDAATSTMLNSHEINYIPKCKSVPQDIHRRMKIVEEQYRRIILVCSSNMEILKEIDDISLAPLIEELKVSILVKDKQIIDEKKRFERYKRFLLNSVKDYRKSYKLKEKQYESLRNLYFPIVSELKHLTNYFPMEKNRLLNSDKVDDITKVIQKINSWTERIQMHTKSVNYSNSLKTPNINGNIQKTVKEEEIGPHSKKRTLIDSQFSEDPEKLSLCILPNHMNKTEDTFDETDHTTSSFQEHINICSSHIANLKKEKSILQTALTQRDHLLGNIFNSFKRKIEGVAEEISEKYFLQRLCNDLKSAIKVYGYQNRILKETLESNNICVRNIYIQRTLRRNSANISEDYIKGLLDQQRDSCQIQETFSDIQCRIESMKNNLSVLNVAIKR